MSAQINIEALLKNLRECQVNHSVSACSLCANAENCGQKKEFEASIREDLSIKLKNLQDCQESKTLQSCLNCKEMLDCKTRLEYVSAVYLNMNKGNGGSFEF
ncbi:MAG: hypothetical protein PUB96_01260 [Helicobacteraceae bacterium]|nr:hypothetical protein [Helicobacteraceae bacterium]